MAEHEVLLALTGTPQAPDGRLLLRARCVISLEQSAIDLDKQVPLGDTTAETLAHIQALVVEPALALAQTLVRSHFAALQYALGQEEPPP